MQGYCFDSAYVKDYIKWSSQNKITITKMSMFNNFIVPRNWHNDPIEIHITK